MRVACRITLVEKDRKMLERWWRGRSTPARLVMRAKITLKAAAGMKNKEIFGVVRNPFLTTLTSLMIRQERIPAGALG